MRNPFLLRPPSPRIAGAAIALAFFASCPAGAAPPHDGAHDFDFEFGSWQVRIRRLAHPLTGSTTWTQYAGASVVTPVWGGLANLGELNVRGSAGAIRGLSLRLYDPSTHQWRISWSNANDGRLTPPLIGGFEDGQGEFFDQEELAGKAILARFIFSDISKTRFRIVQAFSNNGGKTWESNWIANFTR